jgi:hypothetical protein
MQQTSGLLRQVELTLFSLIQTASVGNDALAGLECCFLAGVDAVAASLALFTFSADLLGLEETQKLQQAGLNFLESPSLLPRLTSAPFLTVSTSC